jgi:endoglucanase
MIEHYGWSTIAGNTRPMWKNNLVGDTTFTNAHFANLYTQLATYFSGNDLVGFGMLNEPNNMSTMTWFSTAQAVITAIRNTGNTAWIFVPGNGYSSWQWISDDYDTASIKRSSAYGWENANGVGFPLSDPLNKLIAAPHIYMDDEGGTTYKINAVGGGAQVNALVDRISVVVDWARGFNTRHRTAPIKVYLGEIGYYAGTTTTAGYDGNYTGTTAQTCWNNFITYLGANSDVFVGFAWWAASDIGWWSDVGRTHFSVTPTTSGTVYSGDTINMNMIENTFF